LSNGTQAAERRSRSAAILHSGRYRGSYLGRRRICGQSISTMSRRAADLQRADGVAGKAVVSAPPDVAFETP
jgi:hypothetical protein